MLVVDILARAVSVFSGRLVLEETLLGGWGASHVPTLDTTISCHRQGRSILVDKMDAHGEYTARHSGLIDQVILI